MGILYGKGVLHRLTFFLTEIFLYSMRAAKRCPSFLKNIPFTKSTFSMLQCCKCA